MKTYNSLKKNHLRGFSLIELLVVVSIIVVLSGLTIGVSGWVQRKSAISKAEAHLELLQSQMEAYAADVGGYPQKRDNNGLIVYTMLFGDGVGKDGVAGTSDDTRPDGKPDEGATIYLDELDPNANNLKMVDPSGPNARPQKLLDPFGNPWRYRSGTRYNPQNPDFDLWSVGPDGKDNTEDDIRNW